MYMPMVVYFQASTFCEVSVVGPHLHPPPKGGPVFIALLIVAAEKNTTLYTMPAAARTQVCGSCFANHVAQD